MKLIENNKNTLRYSDMPKKSFTKHGSLCNFWYNRSFYFDAVRYFVYLWSFAFNSNIGDLPAYSQVSALSRARLKMH